MLKFLSLLIILCSSSGDIKFSELLENIDVETYTRISFYDDFFKELIIKSKAHDKPKESELYDEELIESVIKKFKRKHKDILLDLKFYEVARKAVKIMKILKKPIIKIEKVDITSSWCGFFNMMGRLEESYMSKIMFE